jgi:asparagine synthase (glutamine-hydrolysing)
LLNRTAVSGVIGKVMFDPREPLAPAALEQMLDALAHTADAARGLHLAPGIGLGWCGRDGGSDQARSRDAAGAASRARDGSAAGRAATLHVCAWAALTNATDLRRDLEQRGHRFVSTRDDELILRAYEEWDRAAFGHLRGPFVCAIWDERERRLVIARDHVGVRPLFFALLPDRGVVFATSVRALLRDAGVRREWCPAAIDAYLTLGYVPAPLSAYRRISKLEAGHLLVVEGRRLHVEPYWDIPAPAHSRAAEPELIVDIAARLRRAVAAHAGDDAAVLYSGGIPSTTLLAAGMGSLNPVVTVPLDHDAGDLVRSGRAANMLGRARDLEAVTVDAAALARDLAAAGDEPVGDPAAIEQLAVCRGVGRRARAALGAHGAAALWAGSAHHRIERLEAAARMWLRWPLASIGAEIGRSLPASVKGARALAHLAMPPADAYAVKHAYGLWDDDHRRTLYTRRFAWEVRQNNPFSRHLELYADGATRDALDRAIYVDAHTVVPDSLLPMAATAARAAGLDLRFPMLDVDAVECAARTPAALKQRGPAGMYALRALLARELPPGLLPPARRVPARHGWLGGALLSLVPAVLLTPRFDERGIVSRPALRQLWHQHQAGRRNHAHRLWLLLMLELWFRDVIDGNAADVPLEYAILAPRRPAARSAVPAQHAA